MRTKDRQPDDPLPRHRPEGRRLRAAGTRRDGARDGLQCRSARPRRALFESAGFSWLHVVDLNGAFEGRAVNENAVRNILAGVSIPVQLGGGIRNMADIGHWLEAGVKRVVLGTAAVKNPSLVREAAKKFPGCIAVAIDAKDGIVAVEGWAEATALRAAELARRFADAGVAALIYTDIGRDGMLRGLNVEATAVLARVVPVPVIASGGVKGLDDIKRAKDAGVIAGVIIGRALYDGGLDAKAALAVARD